MYYHQALTPQELSRALSNAGECFFVIQAILPTRCYQVAVYRYDCQYFILTDSRLFQQIRTISGEIQGDEEEILSYIEEALEDNHYFLTEEAFIKLELQILKKMKQMKEIEIAFYEFIDV